MAEIKGVFATAASDITKSNLSLKRCGPKKKKRDEEQYQPQNSQNARWKDSAEVWGFIKYKKNGIKWNEQRDGSVNTAS